MAKLDPIIAVKDVGSQFYFGINKFLGFRRTHGGKERFAVLVSENDEIMLCLHKREEHNHPTLMLSGITPGNGLMLYFRTDDMKVILQKIWGK